MSEVSEIKVEWTPNDSGRVSSIQIQSRIHGQFTAQEEGWTEQAAAYSPTAGVFTFTSNAPGAEVEVRTRYRMTSGVYGAWIYDDIVTAKIEIPYIDLTGTPSKLEDINDVEGKKLGTVENGATVGAIMGTNVKNPDGTIYVPPSGGQLVDSTPPGKVTNLAGSSVLTDTAAEVKWTWTAPTDSDLAAYDVEVKEADGGWIPDSASGTTYLLRNARRNTTYSFHIRAYDKSGNRGAWSSDVSVVSLKDNDPPGPVTSVTVETAFNTAFINFKSPVAADFSYVKLNLLSSTNTLLSSQIVAGKPNSMMKATLGSLTKATRYSVNLTAYDTSDNASTIVTSGQFDTAGGVAVADFTPGLTPIATVATLPSNVNYTGPAVVFLQSDGKLYRYTSGVWTKTVDGFDIAANAINSTHIVDNSINTAELADAAVQAAKIADAAVTGSKVADSAIVTAKIASGAITETKIGDDSITTPKIKTGAISADKIQANAVSADKIQANAVTTNKLVAANRPLTISGLNIRAQGGSVVWDAGFITYINDAGVSVTQQLVASALGAVSASVTNPLFIRYEVGSGKNYLDYSNDKVYLGLDNMKQIATWSGGTDLAIHAGISTIIDGGRIVTGSIKAGQIAAGTITADKLIVSGGTGSALNADPSFVDPSIWSLATLGASFQKITNGIAGGSALQLTSAGTAIQSNDRIPVDRNKAYRFHVWARRASGSMGLIYAGIALSDAEGGNINGDGTFWYYCANAQKPGSDWVLYEGVIGAGYRAFPSNARYMSINIFGNYPEAGQNDSVHMFQDARIEEVIPGNLIVNGAITADKIAANAVTADKIAANTINAGKLTVSSRPVSVAGCNIRYDPDGIVRWNAGTITFPDINGNFIMRNVVAGAQGWGGWDKPVNFCYDTNVNNGSFGVYYSQDLPAYPSVIPVAIWNSASNDFQVKGGVSTLINGDRIVTGTINADKLLAGSITADKIASGTITAAQLAAGAITASKLAIGSLTDLNTDPGFRDPTMWANNGAYNGPLLTAPGFGWYNNHGQDINAVMGTSQYIMLWSGYYTSAARQHVFGAVQYNMKGGETYEFSAFGNNASNQAMIIYFRTWGADGTYLGDEGINFPVGLPAQKLSKQITPYANAASYQFIVFNEAQGPAFSGHMECTNISVTRVSGATAIQNGAITTDKIVVGSLNGDRIQTGTLSADKIQAGSVLAGTISVGTQGTLNDIAQKAQNGSPLTWVQFQGVYTINGNLVTKTGGGDAWDYNAIVEQPLRGTFVLTGKFPSQATFFGVRQARDLSTYGGFDYSWHRSSNGDWYIFENGNAIWNGRSGAGINFDDNTIFKIEHVGNVVNYWADGGLIRSRPSSPNLTWWAQIDIATPGASIRLLSWSQTSDNSLVNTDPAARINAYSSVIDPGKILISGGTTLANWRAGGDNTKIEGGNIYANSIKANSLAIGNRGIGFIGLNFEWNPTNNWVYWTDGYIYYIDDNNNPNQSYIAAGNTGGAGAHQWFYWNKGSTRLDFSQENPAIAPENRVFIGAWWGGSNLNINYGGTIINGDRITTNTIHANKIIAGTISADKMNVGILSAISSNLGAVMAGSININDRFIVAADGNTTIRSGTSGQRTEYTSNGMKVYHSNGTMIYQNGIY